MKSAEEMMEKILTEDFKESADDEVYALTRACGSRPIAGAWRLR